MSKPRNCLALKGSLGIEKHVFFLIQGKLLKSWNSGTTLLIQTYWTIMAKQWMLTTDAYWIILSKFSQNTDTNLILQVQNINYNLKQSDILCIQFFPTANVVEWITVSPSKLYDMIANMTVCSFLTLWHFHT